MSLTPHRDAAAATVAHARQKVIDRGPREPVQDIGERMSIEAVEAVILGSAELLDRQVHVGVVADVVNRVLASCLASFLLTACGGREEAALKLIPLALEHLGRATVDRVTAATQDGIVANADLTGSEPRGQA